MSFSSYTQVISCTRGCVPFMKSLLLELEIKGHISYMEQNVTTICAI